MKRRHLGLIVFAVVTGFAGCAWDVTPRAADETPSVPEVLADETPELPEEAPADPVADHPKEDCANEMDDDGDGFADCVDWDCSVLPECMPPAVVAEHCDDDADNDGDGAIDCKDTDCDENDVCKSKAIGPYRPPSAPPAKQAPIIDFQDL